MPQPPRRARSFARVLSRTARSLVVLTLVAFGLARGGSKTASSLPGQIPNAPAYLAGFPIPFYRSADYRPLEGSVVAADRRACVVDLARLLTRYCAEEACGKTIPCRIGLRRVSEIGDRIATGLPKPTDLGLLADLSSDIIGSALCDHERLATLPFASGMRYFRGELDEHILRSSCPAGVCRPVAIASGAPH